MDLELVVLAPASPAAGAITAFAVTDDAILAVAADRPLVSSNGRDFRPRAAWQAGGWHAALAVADQLWACGDGGRLAVSRDLGETWQAIESGSDGGLFGLTLGHDGALWVVGDRGYAARLLGGRPQRVELGSLGRLTDVLAARDEIVVVGIDGTLRRWRRGRVTTRACGTDDALTCACVTATGTWIVAGAGGFFARSVDGQWFARAAAPRGASALAIQPLADGRLVAAGERGLLVVSTDDGRSWHPVPHGLGDARLAAVARFGDGVLIGGDGGVIARLAPPDDATWRDRPDRFAVAPGLDPVFAAGPDGFVARGLAAYLDAVALDHGAGDADDALGDHAFDDDHGDRDDVAFVVLGEPGDAAAFHRAHGVALPAGAACLLACARGRDDDGWLEELRLDVALRPDVGDHNLFELMVRRNQHAYLGTDLVEAFSGVFAIASQPGGDSYHLELYEWDGPRQVLHFDHESQTFTRVVAESLDSLIYLAALARAKELGRIAPVTYAAGLRALDGRVAPPARFALDDGGAPLERLEAKRRESEFFFYRSRWIQALLRHDRASRLDDLPRLFSADLNQVVPADQLASRYEACERYIPTALYAMWRAYLFDEPELARYLEIGERHAARLVRDATRLIAELRAGRRELGTITDWPGYLAAFRALDLDPRRADQRRREAEARDRAARARRAEVLAELDATPPAGWAELAWRWLDDRVAHRTVLERLAARGDGEPAVAQLAALDELRALDDHERLIAVPALARELAPELEALLAGSLVRDDDLAGVLVRPPDDVAEPRDDDARAARPGWAAIDRALAARYGDAAPLHYRTVVPYRIGGNDPLHAIAVYARVEPVPHWHFVTYGFTDLAVKETEDPDHSGFGFELTLRLARRPDDEEPPRWALDFLQNLARYVFGTGNRFAAGHKMGLNGPIAAGHPTQITAVCFADDPELDDIASPFGAARFVQVVGITDDEYRRIQEWSTTGLLDILRERLPLLVTDLARASVLADPATAAEIEQRVAHEGSSEDLTYAGELGLHADDGRVRIELGALYAATLPRAMRGRIRHGRPYELRGRAASLHLEPGATAGYRRDNGELVLTITQELAREIERALAANHAGRYRFETCPELEVVVTPSFIRDQRGRAIEVRGITDPDLARRMLDAENARPDAAADDEPAAAADDDPDDEPAVDPARLADAVALTERALRLAPDDGDVQHAHALLLIDAAHAGAAGRLDELFAWLPRFEPAVRIQAAVRLAELGHPRFAEAAARALDGPLPDHMTARRAPAAGGEAAIAFGGDAAVELLADLGHAILGRAPALITRLCAAVPDDVNLLSDLAWQAIEVGQRDAALALYDRVLGLPIPEPGDDRANYLRVLNNACIQAHAVRAFDAAVRIADRAQPIAHENPYIFHSAACAYAAAGDYARAFEQVKLAVEHGYDHVDKIEVDADLGPLLEWPDFKALFRDWRARQEGN